MMFALLIAVKLSGLKNCLVKLFFIKAVKYFSVNGFDRKYTAFCIYVCVYKGDTMDSNTKIAKSYVSHEEVQSAMEQFLASGGKITKVEDPCQEILLKHDMGEETLDNIDPHAANPSSNGLGDIGGILKQKMQSEHKEV